MSAVGSLKHEYAPGHFVLVDQFIDRTFAREKSFFGKGCVAHVSMAHPVSERLVDALDASCRELGQPYNRGGPYITMDGPQFSTRSESTLYHHWSCHDIRTTKHAT